MSHFPAILLSVIVLIIWIRYEIKKSGRSDEKESKSFWEKENEANFARKKDLSSLDYITIPDSLGFEPPEESAGTSSSAAASEGTSKEISLIEKQISELSKKKIVNFTGITNTRLKLEYGAANLELLTEYDQNYTLLVRTLDKWSSLLLNESESVDESKNTQAKKILEFAVSIKTDISQSYFNLAKIYKSDGQPERISELIKTAENLNSLSKEHIIKGLKEILFTED